MNRKGVALAWALVVCLLLAHNAYLWLGQRIVPDTDILNLLPVQERDPLLQQSFTHMVDAAQQRVVVLLARPTGPTPGALPMRTAQCWRNNRICCKRHRSARAPRAIGWPNSSSTD